VEKRSVSNPWFRFYASVVNDPKVQRLEPRLFKTWVNLLCVAAEHDGALPHLSDLAFALRLPEDALAADYDALVAAGLIDEHDDHVTPHNWSGRQFQSDVSTDRVKRFRDKKRNVSETASETPPDTEQNRTDSEAIASGASAPIATLDPKTILFDRGLAELSRLTDRPPAQLRSVLGRWLKLTGNDAGAILAEIEKCRGSPVADPIAWIERQLKPQERTNANTADSQHERNRRALANVVAKRAHAGGDAVVSAAFASPRQPQAIGYLEQGERPAGDARLRTG